MADPTDKLVVPPGSFLITKTVTPLSIDGLPIDQVKGGQGSQIQPGQQVAEGQRFWASPPRPIGDKADAALLINLAKPRTINYLSFDLPHFPQHFYLFYYDDKKKNWFPVQNSDGYDVRIYITGNVPYVIGPANVLAAHQHPSHYGADHWIHYEVDCKPFTASKLHLTGTRVFGGRGGGPKDVHGKDAAYSLGMRNLDFGYRIRKKIDVPLTPRDPDIITERESFTVVTDILGSPVELSMRENRATDLNLGRMWKCEPQPASYAVVPLYVDSRDAEGNPQVIDRFYIEPITSGVRLNLYYSEAPPDPVDFEAEDTPLTFPLTRQAGQGTPILDGDGLAFPDQIAYVDVSNQAMQWDPTKPFWIGIDIQPQFESSEATDHVIWDAGPLSLMWRDQEWTLAFDNGYLTLPQFDFSFNHRLQFVIGYDGEHVYFYAPQGGVILLPANIEGLTIQVIRFGAESGFTAEDLILTGAYRLRSFVLKKETLSFISAEAGLVVPEAVQSFLDDSAAYVRKAPFAGEDTGSTKNSLLRFGLIYVMGTPDNGINPWGFVGGPGDVYDDVIWTPVNRDFALHKGFLQFAPTRASCFKFEFTHLQPQPYEVYQPKTAKVRVFPSAIVASATPTQPSGDTGAGSSGLIANNDAAHPLTYADSVRLRYAQASPTSQGDTVPTEAMYATDPATAERLAAYGGLYNLQPWQPPASAPRFTTTARHYYEEVEVKVNSRVAYFVALSKLQMFRVDYATNDDTDIYLETFGDLGNVDPASMTPMRVEETFNHAVNPSFELDSNSDGMPDSYSLTSAGTVTGTVAQSSDTARFGSYGLKINATVMGSLGTDRLGVNIAPLGSPDALITENFETSAINGWSTAPTGQTWINSGGANSDFSKTGGKGQISLTSVNVRRFVTISRSLADTTITGKFKVPVTATGASISEGVVTRYIDDNNFYMVQFLHDTAGTVDVEIVKRVAGTFTTLASASNYIAYTPGTELNFKTYTIGTGLGIKVWSGSTEPGSWAATATDSTYARGKAGVQANLVASNTNTLPVNVTFDDLSIVNEEAVGLDMGNSLAISVYARVIVGAPVLRFTVEYYDVANAFLSSSTSTFSGVGTAWQRLEATYTPPVNSDHVKVYVWAEAGNGPVQVYLDGLQVEEGHVSDYCDGNQSGCVWTGTANASVSQRVGIGVNPWHWAPGALSTPADISDPVLAISKVMASKRKVRGIQFATQQSSPVQLLIDPDFDDPLIRSWEPVGDSSPLEVSAEFNSAVGSMVKVSRQAGIGNWDELEASYDSWDEVEAAHQDWNSMEIAFATVSVGGLAYKADVRTTKAGRLYAAARVYTDAPLADPLTLQIVDSSGTVLAEASREVKGGRINEWFVGYTIGEGTGMETASTWNDIENLDPLPTEPTWNDLEVNTWDSLDTTVDPLGTNVSVQILQQGSSDDVWYVDTLSLFEDAIVWEFSNDGGTNWWPVYDIRNDPHGVFIFPEPSPITESTGTQLMWRVSGYRPYLHVNHLAIRPWYGSLPLGVPHREPGLGGPNINPTDHFPPVELDPHWQAWHEPVPQDWFFEHRQLLLLGRPTLPVDTTTPSQVANVWINPDALIPISPPPPPETPPEEPVPGPEIYVDLYGDPYSGTYGAEAGGDTYSDNYGNGTY